MFKTFLSFTIWFLTVYLAIDAYALCTPSGALSTQPLLPDNTLASGYVNFTVQACIHSTSVFKCSWKYGTIDQKFFTSDGHCIRSDSRNHVIECAMNNKTINTNFTLSIPAFMGKNDFVLHCENAIDAPVHSISTPVVVQNCPPSLGSNQVTVNSSSGYQYGSQGIFVCPENNKLFDENGNYKNNSSTICNEVAKWKNSEGLQCWAAPTVTLTVSAITQAGIVNVTEGSAISFNCSYDDVIPSGNQSVFSFNGKETIKSKGESFVVSNITRDYHDKSIFCQAVTNYTKVFKEEGKSNPLYFNVLFTPQVTSDAICFWKINITQTCLVEFVSNPGFSFVSFAKQGISCGQPINVSGNSALTKKAKATLVSTKNFRQIFNFTINKVSQDDIGIYYLNIFSQAFSMNYSFVIVIISKEETVFTTSTNTSSSTAAAMGVLFFLSLVAIGILLLKIRRERVDWTCFKGISNKRDEHNVSNAISSQSGNIDQRAQPSDDDCYESLEFNSKIEDKSKNVNPNATVSASQEGEENPSCEYEAIGERKPSCSANQKHGYVTMKELSTVKKTTEEEIKEMKIL